MFDVFLKRLREHHGIIDVGRCEESLRIFQYQINKTLRRCWEISLTRGYFYKLIKTPKECKCRFKNVSRTNLYLKKTSATIQRGEYGCHPKAIH